MDHQQAQAQIQKVKNEFRVKISETTMGKLRSLSRQKLGEYYDYFAAFHCGSDPQVYREFVIAAEDRMASLQSELHFRRQRDVQYTVALLAALVVIVGLVFQYNRSGNENTKPGRYKTQQSATPSSSKTAPTP